MVAVHLGTSPEMLMVAEGASTNMAMLAVSEVAQTEWKTGGYEAFDVESVGEDTKTTRGVSSNSEGGTGVHLPFGAGMGTGMEAGVGTNGFGVAGGLRAACSQG